MADGRPSGSRILADVKEPGNLTGPGKKLRRALGSIFTWLNDRIGFAAVMPLLRKKEVPLHRHSFWYYIGGMALFLFVLQIATGILLLFYYRSEERRVGKECAD